MRNYTQPRIGQNLQEWGHEIISSTIGERHVRGHIKTRGDDIWVSFPNYNILMGVTCILFIKVIIDKSIVNIQLLNNIIFDRRYSKRTMNGKQFSYNMKSVMIIKVVYLSAIETKWALWHSMEPSTSNFIFIFCRYIFNQ